MIFRRKTNVLQAKINAFRPIKIFPTRVFSINYKIINILAVSPGAAAAVGVAQRHQQGTRATRARHERAISPVARVRARRAISRPRAYARGAPTAW